MHRQRDTELDREQKDQSLFTGGGGRPLVRSKALLLRNMLLMKFYASLTYDRRPHVTDSKAGKVCFPLGSVGPFSQSTVHYGSLHDLCFRLLLPLKRRNGSHLSCVSACPCRASRFSTRVSFQRRLWFLVKRRSSLMMLMLVLILTRIHTYVFCTLLVC